uniref:Sushi domain-containing protein n=1 Tax=Hucho hucho TaxID=62062 RepID=A0A4W5JWI9_9TELE
EPPLEENHLVLRSLDSDFGTVELSCEDGYVLHGARTLRCTPAQEWNDTFPVCKQVFCGPPPEIANGIVDVQGLMYLSTALFSCKLGYTLVGNATVLCGESGLWIGGVPSCRPIECSVPKEIPNGKVAYTKLQFTHAVTYSCRRGYRLQGPETLKCLANGQWDQETPVCVQIYCAPPYPIDNGFVEGLDHKFGVTIFYSCFPSFQLVGQNHLTCEEFGWSSSVPVCVPSDCGLPPHIDFGGATVAFSPMDMSFLHGTVIVYRCHKGYELTSDSLSCQSEGTWSKQSIRCRPTPCPLPANLPTHIMVTGEDLTPVGGVVTLSCPTGFILQGPGLAECQVRLLLCQQKNCGEICFFINCIDVLAQKAIRPSTDRKKSLVDFITIYFDYLFYFHIIHFM